MCEIYEVSNGHTKGRYHYKQKSWFFAWKIKLVDSYIDWLKIRMEQRTLQHIKHTIFLKGYSEKNTNKFNSLQWDKKFLKDTS